jgi:hypothetical protein
MHVRELLFAAALFSPAAMNAQMGVGVVWPVAAGSKVRIMSPVLGDRQQVGIAASATADTLSFRPEAGGTFNIATPNIAKMDLAVGSHTRKARGAGIGFLVGAAVGAALGAASFKECQGFCIMPDTRGFDAALGGVLLGAVGAVVGTMAGARHMDTWVPVAVPHSSQTP